MLYLNGDSCLEHPLEKRKEIINTFFPESSVVEKVSGQIINIKDERCCEVINEHLRTSVSKGLEGLFIKALGPKTFYDSSSRTQWAKVSQG